MVEGDARRAATRGERRRMTRGERRGRRMGKGEGDAWRGATSREGANRRAGRLAEKKRKRKEKTNRRAPRVRERKKGAAGAGEI